MPSRPAIGQFEPLPGGSLRAEDRPQGDSAPRLQVYLHAGQLFASAEPASVVTVLGSCVAVCLFDPVARVGGMNHYLLPLAVQRERSTRFGNVAIARLVEEVLERGARRASLQAKVFGGAGVFAASGARSLGNENAELALLTLEAEAIPVLESDVGGPKGRKLVFHTDAGDAWVRCL